MFRESKWGIPFGWGTLPCYLIVMKFWIAIPGLALWSVAAAEPFEPGKTPTAFETNSTGQTGEGSVSIDRTTPEKITKKVTYVVVSKRRDWRNTDGNIIQASMLAFDPLPGASKDAPLPLVRNGNIRLWIEERKKETEYPLAKLSPQDREFVSQLLEAQKAAAQTAEKE